MLDVECFFLGLFPLSGDWRPLVFAQTLGAFLLLLGEKAGMRDVVPPSLLKVESFRSSV